MTVDHIIYPDFYSVLNGQLTGPDTFIFSPCRKSSLATITSEITSIQKIEACTGNTSECFVYINTSADSFTSMKD